MRSKEIHDQGKVPRASLAIFLCMVSAAAAARAQERVVREDASNVDAARQMLSDMRWMTGSWSGPGLGGQAEEHWTKAAGGTMIGTFRLVGSDDKLTFCELIMIELEGRRVVGRFRHFGPKHTPWEPPDAPLELDLVRTTLNEAVFESPAGESPRRLTYRKESSGELTIQMQTEKKDGALQNTFTLTLARTELGR